MPDVRRVPEPDLVPYLRLLVGARKIETDFIHPQVAHMGLDYAWEDARSVIHLRTNQSLDYQPNLQSFCLDDDTPRTDMLSQGYVQASGFLVSQRLYDVLTEYRLQPHQPFPATVMSGGRAARYVWMHLVDPRQDPIVYASSRFQLRRADGRHQDFAVADAAGLREVCSEVDRSGEGGLLIHTLALAPGYEQLDLFCVRLTGACCFVSGRLSDGLSRVGLSGFRVEGPATLVRFTP